MLNLMPNRKQMLHSIPVQNMFHHQPRPEVGYNIINNYPTNPVNPPSILKEMQNNIIEKTLRSQPPPKQGKII
jgi:hypothetical protein